MINVWEWWKISVSSNASWTSLQYIFIYENLHKLERNVKLWKYLSKI